MINPLVVQAMAELGIDLDEAFPARPCDPDERLAVTQNGGSRLNLVGGARRALSELAES